jgi:cellobiose-specific phosphotransferase system component IIB
MMVKTQPYHVQLREWYVYDLNVVANSAAEAIEKVEAFYVQQRKPQTKYQQEGLTAALQEKSVRCARRATSQSAWAKARAAARDSQRDAVKAA